MEADLHEAAERLLDSVTCGAPRIPAILDALRVARAGGLREAADRIEGHTDWTCETIAVWLRAFAAQSDYEESDEPRP